jgi:hypothetical protein
MAEIFKNFNAAEDIIVGDVQIVSSPLWSENMNPYTTSSTGIGFFTSSLQSASSGKYYVDVYHREPTTATNAEVQFSIAYGHILGSGSVGDPNTVGQNVNDTPTRAIYSQYRNLLLPPTDPVFSFGGDEPESIFVINIARARFRQKIDPGNWTLRFSSTFEVTDDSGAADNPEIGASGRIFNIRSGSQGVLNTANTNVYGLFYPDAGIMVFDGDKFDAGLDGAPNLAFGTGNTLAGNAQVVYRAISGSRYFAARSEEKVNSTHYFVRITNRQFNFTNNPTFITGSNGDFVHPQMLSNPSVYVTTVGMYDNLNRLLAVAKLSQPLLKTFNREVLIKVKLDY